ncbi:UNVERIFIED_CONTAM: hypothetical protein Scaly_2810600 [Sesamum calycinum]|uniref:Polyprotein n=1 Tax=Sesamum calycinum TaxID=2727403 RepID=A0AAW2IW14_9LAMI
MKDLGEANFILGMKITKTCDGIFLDQSHYIDKILRKYNFIDCKHVTTPFDPYSLISVENDDDVINQKEYASLIGSLRYATDCTRPDIAYDVGEYLAGDSCSTTGYIFILGGAAICWKSKKQTIIANSTMEAELIALASASEEANWLRDLLFQIPYFETLIAPISIHCDSTAALGRVQNRYYNGHTKDTYFEIYGYPDWNKALVEKRKLATSASNALHTTKEELKDFVATSVLDHNDQRVIKEIVRNELRRILRDNDLLQTDSEVQEEFNDFSGKILSSTTGPQD